MCTLPWIHSREMFFTLKGSWKICDVQVHRFQMKFRLVKKYFLITFIVLGIVDQLKAQSFIESQNELVKILTNDEFREESLKAWFNSTQDGRLLDQTEKKTRLLMILLELHSSRFDFSSIHLDAAENVLHLLGVNPDHYFAIESASNVSWWALSLRSGGEFVLSPFVVPYVMAVAGSVIWLYQMWGAQDRLSTSLEGALIGPSFLVLFGAPVFFAWAKIDETRSLIINERVGVLEPEIYPHAPEIGEVLVNLCHLALSRLSMRGKPVAQVYSSRP